MNGTGEIITAASVAYSHDLSILGLFAQASLTVKGVIILLLISSLWSWSITFAKLSLMKKLKVNGDKFEDSFWNSGSMDILYDDMVNKNDDPFVSVFVTGMKELRRTKTKVKSAIGGISLKDRIDRMMRVTVGREIDYLERHLGFLATVGSTAPFVGLFGTVWGIMNSFESIGFEQNTSLTSVAPGIAEALFATALALVVTIPAVIAYNKISSEINRYQNRLDAFVDEFSAIISRQIEDTEV
ncbi:MAG: protein TolQ [Holosporaceae bacterium]|jgi:biopolymer transport protein TolQ|nr:protein TolQ [Holosporaceae bacterium]